MKISPRKLPPRTVSLAEAEREEREERKKQEQEAKPEKVRKGEKERKEDEENAEEEEEEEEEVEKESKEEEEEEEEEERRKRQSQKKKIRAPPIAAVSKSKSPPASVKAPAPKPKVGAKRGENRFNPPKEAKDEAEVEKSSYSSSFRELFSSIRPAISQTEGSIDQVLLCTIFEYLGIVEFAAIQELIRKLPRFEKEIYGCVHALRIQDDDLPFFDRISVQNKKGRNGNMPDRNDRIVEFIRLHLPHLTQLTMPFTDDVNVDEEVSPGAKIPTPAFPRPNLIAGFIFHEEDIVPGGLTLLRTLYPKLQALEGEFKVRSQEDYLTVEPFLNARSEVNFILDFADPENLATVQQYIDNFPGNNFIFVDAEESGDLAFNNKILYCEDYPDSPRRFADTVVHLQNIQATMLKTEKFPDVRVFENIVERKRRQGLEEKEGPHFLTLFTQNNPAIKTLSIYVTEAGSEDDSAVGEKVISGEIPLPPVEVLYVTDETLSREEEDLSADDFPKFTGPGLNTVKILIVRLASKAELLAMLNLFPRLEKISLPLFKGKAYGRRDQELFKTLEEWNYEHGTKIIAKDERKLIHRYIPRTKEEAAEMAPGGVETESETEEEKKVEK